MKQAEQCTIYKITKNIMEGVFTIAIIFAIFLFTQITVFASESYMVNTTDVATLQNKFIGVATVSENSGIITITLTNDFYGCISFEGTSENTFVLDAAGFTLDGSDQNGVLELSNSNDAKVILKGNGIYQSGIHNTIYVGGQGKLVVESGTFNVNIATYFIIRGYCYFQLADGYDYYTVTTQNGNLLLPYNKQEKSKYSINLEEVQMVVSQCYGEVPSYTIDALASENGSYSFQVNGMDLTVAEIDDLSTLTFNPNTNYGLKGITVTTHVTRQEKGALQPYEWFISYREINQNSFELDITECGLKKLAHLFNAAGLLPGICRMDYLMSNLMGNGFIRTKTLGDGDNCCNCHYELIGKCEWAPEKGFTDRK